jgi:hypothetical protein
MKRQIKKWTLRLIVTGLLIAGLLFAIILNPILTYANKTIHNNFNIYHNTQLDPFIILYLDDATDLLKKSEFYNERLKLDICLNDGSKYPNMIKAIRGRAFAWGFYNKVVLQGTMNCKENFIELNGYKWNLIELLTHEMVHCIQFDKLGFWKSKPFANIDNWKWEGYAEYIARQKQNQKTLLQNIEKLNHADKNNWEIILDDGTITAREYVEYWIMVQYCMDIKGMSYQQLLKDSSNEWTIRQEMNAWYESKK